MDKVIENTMDDYKRIAFRDGQHGSDNFPLRLIQSF